MRAAKVDANQRGIVDALERAGCSVESLARLGNGAPDVLVARAGNMFLLELKTPKGELNERQMRWHSFWKAKVHVVRTVEEAFAAVGLRGAA